MLITIMLSMQVAPLGGQSCYFGSVVTEKISWFSFSSLSHHSHMESPDPTNQELPVLYSFLTPPTHLQDQNAGTYFEINVARQFVTGRLFNCPSALSQWNLSYMFLVSTQCWWYENLSGDISNLGFPIASPCCLVTFIHLFWMAVRLCKI